MTTNHYVVQLIANDNFKLNSREYIKGERLLVWDFDDKCYSISNMRGEYLLKKNCKKVYAVSFEKCKIVQNKFEICRNCKHYNEKHCEKLHITVAEDDYCCSSYKEKDEVLNGF